MFPSAVIETRFDAGTWNSSTTAFIAASSPLSETTASPILTVDPLASTVSSAALSVTGASGAGAGSIAASGSATASPVAAAEPEVILSSSSPIMDESPATETLLGQETEKAETFADLNPHEQGYAVGMSDIDGEELPPAESTSNFSDFSEPEPAPVTFDDLTHNETVTVEEPTPAIVEPAVETETVAEPEVVAEPEAVAEPDRHVSVCGY